MTSILKAAILDVRAQAKAHLAKELEINAVTYPYDISEDFVRTLSTVLQEVEPDSSGHPRLFDSCRAAQMTFPAGRCYRGLKAWEDIVEEDDIILLVDVLGSRVLVAITEKTTWGPVPIARSETILDGSNGTQLADVIAGIVAKAPGPIRHVVLSGDEAESNRDLIMASFKSAAPDLVEMVAAVPKNTAEVVAIGSACWALTVAANKPHFPPMRGLVLEDVPVRHSEL